MSELTISLTNEELTKVNSKKKEEKSLPKYYSVLNGEYIPISRDMEAFLILEDFGFKDTISDSVKAILDNSTNDEEKELFEEAWNNEKNVVENEVADLNSKLGVTSEVRSELRNSKFVNVTDISELLTTVASEQSALSIKQKISQYRLVYLEQFKIKFQPGKVANKDNKKAAESWLTSLSAY